MIALQEPRNTMRKKQTQALPTLSGAPQTDTTQENRLYYELQARGLPGGQLQLEIWQLPTAASPRLHKKERTAGLKGRVLQIVEVRVLRQLKASGIRLDKLQSGETRQFYLDESTALTLALLFRALAPMANIDRIRAVTHGIEQMSQQEAGYWLGMAIHRKNPRRVLAALRMLLTM